MTDQFSLEIDFQNPLNKETTTLKWRIVDRNYALIWIKLLGIHFKRQGEAYARFTGFELATKTLASLSKELNTAAELINEEGHYHIKEKADGTFSQEFANVIHHHFEVLYGDAHDPSEYFRKSSAFCQSAITRINHCIHDMESLSRVKENPRSFRAVVFEFLEREQMYLSSEDLEYFTLDTDFGDVVVHYGIVGKTWLEVYLDEDEEIFESGIRPLNIMSGEFDIFFGKLSLSNTEKEELYELLRSRGKDPKNKKHALGFLPLAKLDYPSDKVGPALEEEVCQLVTEHSVIKNIRILKNGVHFISSDFEESDTIDYGFFPIRETVEIEQGGKIPLLTAPVQFIPVRGKGGPVTISSIPFSGGYPEKAHLVTLKGVSDDCPVTLIPGEEFKGLKVPSSTTLKNGDFLHLSYDGESGYYPVKKK